MICTVVIDGCTVEISGTDGECFQFLGRLKALPEFCKWTFPKKLCNPLARHYGNCGAEDRPIIQTDSLWECSNDRVHWTPCGCGTQYHRYTRKMATL